MSQGTRFERDWDLCVNILTVPGAIPGIPPVDLKDATTRLLSKHVDKLIENGYYEEVPEDEEILGVVRVFLHPEPHKEPPRFRVIHWTYTVNKAPNNTDIHLCSVHEARQSVHKGRWAYSVDVHGCFNQFPIGKEARNQFCVFWEGKWYRLLRLAMGQRQACKIAHTALQIIMLPLDCFHQEYIDNAHGADNDRIALIADLVLLAKRAETARMTFNEDLSRPEDLVKPVVEYLGLVLDHENKTCCITKKTILKLRVSWAACNSWTVRQFCSHMSLLLYCWFATGQHLGRFQLVLKRWARVQSEVQRGKIHYETPMKDCWDHIPQDLWSVLKDWTELAIRNLPIPVNNKELPPQFMLVTDASAVGWAAILISMKSGLYTVIHGDWPRDLLEFVKRSSISEPLALLAGMRGFFVPGVAVNVLHVSDNQGTVGQVNKTFSTAPSQHVMEIISNDFPKVQLRSEYYPGSEIPADEPSRGKSVDRSKLERVATTFGLDPALLQQSSGFGGPTGHNSGMRLASPARRV